MRDRSRQYLNTCDDAGNRPLARCHPKYEETHAKPHMRRRIA
jgi:hypothetical protein